MEQRWNIYEVSAVWFKVGLVQYIHTTIYKIDNKGILYSTGNYPLYLIIIYEKRIRSRIYMCVYIYNWITLMYTGNQCNFINQPSFWKRGGKIRSFTVKIYLRLGKIHDIII